MTIRRVQPVTEQQIAHRPIQVTGGGYVSSQTCRACHPAQYNAWHASFHRTMTQVAMPQSILADFDGVRVSDDPGNPIALERRGGEFWAEFGDPDVSGHPRISRQIVMTTGSHYQQVYWYRTDRTRVLGQLPMTYLVDERRWIPRDSALLHPPLAQPPSETGRWNAVCVNCHTTAARRRFDAPDDVATSGVAAFAADTQAAEFGIACEACHGPAAQHVEQNRNPLHRYLQYLTGRPDLTAIVQPARLTAARSSEVCGQCHGVWEYYDTAGERSANANGLPYRPGDELRETRLVVQPSHDTAFPRAAAAMRQILDAYPGYLDDSFWSDGMIRVSGREYNGLIDSPCFRNATDPRHTLSCLSCHDMHTGPNETRTPREWASTHQVAPEMNGNLACLQCHESIGSAVSAHTKHAEASAGSSCYNCHMPYTTYGLLRALRSHQISSPSVQASVQTGRPNACNGCHLDKTLAWTSDYLQRWYGVAPVALSDDDQHVPASLVDLLRGDAGQRAIAAWSMGWAPAQQASGTAWMAAPLATVLNDPYDAVRLIAGRSLRTLPGFGSFQFDFLAPPAARVSATVRALQQVRPAREQMDLIVRLGLHRNDRLVVLRE